MATITLYKDKINGAGSLLDKIIKSSNSLDTQLSALKNTLQGVDSNTSNLQDKGYTWLHMENGKSMLLVRRDVHDCTLGGFAHTGGASIVRNK